jgi:glycosyltransferase involved in cell wall biosynthesis
MMKVCFVIPRAYYLFNSGAKEAADKTGGAQKQTYLLSVGLAKDSDFEVHFVVADFGQEILEEKQGVKLHKAFSFSDNIFKRSLNFFKSLRTINADCYIFRSADVGVAAALLYLKFFLKRKSLYMIASDAEIDKKTQKKHSGPVTALAMQCVYKQTDLITAQTQSQAKLFEKKRGRKPDAIIKNIYPPNSNSSEMQPERNTVLWVGRLAKIKKPELYLDLAKQRPDEIFVMIAPIVRDAKKYGKHIQAEASKINNLQLINFVKPNEIFDYYRQAKIYVMTSESEGFSNTMAEAMQAACPVLSYKVNPDNILNDYKCGFYAGGNLKKFFSDFDTLNTNPELRKMSGENGSIYIEKHHKFETNVHRFAKLLNSYEKNR